MESSILQEELSFHVRILEKTIRDSSPLISAIAASLETCFRQGNKLMLSGNGGSAALSQHMAAELVNRYRKDRSALAVISLTVDTSILTAIGNDSAFDFTFSRQVEALAKPGDVLAVVSTSGRSTNILKAVEVASRLGVKTIGFTGENGRLTLAPKCDLCLVIPSADTPRIQETQEFIWHVLCGMIESNLFAGQ
jgi:D-sedoheptulose 7-phosphate isomerase